jgi:hypothetical protein
MGRDDHGEQGQRQGIYRIVEKIRYPNPASIQHSTRSIAASRIHCLELMAGFFPGFANR